MKIEAEIDNLNKRDIKEFFRWINKRLGRIPEYYLNKFNKIIIRYKDEEIELKNCYLYDNHEVEGYNQTNLILIKTNEFYYHLRVDEIVKIKLNKEIIEFDIKSKNSLIIKKGNKHDQL